MRAEDHTCSCEFYYTEIGFKRFLRLSVFLKYDLRMKQAKLFYFVSYEWDKNYFGCTVKTFRVFQVLCEVSRGTDVIVHFMSLSFRFYPPGKTSV